MASNTQAEAADTAKTGMDNTGGLGGLDALLAAVSSERTGESNISSSSSPAPASAAPAPATTNGGSQPNHRSAPALRTRRTKAARRSADDDASTAAAEVAGADDDADGTINTADAADAASARTGVEPNRRNRGGAGARATSAARISDARTSATVSAGPSQSPTARTSAASRRGATTNNTATATANSSSGMMLDSSEDEDESPQDAEFYDSIMSKIKVMRDDCTMREIRRAFNATRGEDDIRQFDDNQIETFVLRALDWLDFHCPQPDPFEVRIGMLLYQF